MAWTRPKPSGAAAAAPAVSTGAPPPPTGAPPAAAAPAPAPLPPVTPPPAAQPAPQAAAPAPAARRSRRPAAEAAPTAAAPTPAANAVTQQVIQLPGFLSVLTPRAPGPSGASMIVNGRTTAGEPNIFPTLYLLGGDTGGKLEAHSMNEEGADADLPVGNAPFKAILLGARFEVLIWPKAYERGIKMSPRSKAVIAYDSHQTVDIAQRAAQKYQFRNRATQDQFDAVGHPTMLVELLVYDPQAGIYAIQSTGGYDSLFNTCQELGAAFPVVTPTPVDITPHSYTTKGSRGQKGWLEHFIQIRQDNNSPEMQAIKTEFGAFLQANAADPDLTAAIAAWAKETITEEQIAALREVANIA